MVYLVLYVLLAGLLIMALGLVAKKAMPRSGALRKRHARVPTAEESAYYWLRGEQLGCEVVLAKDLPCLMFKGRKCLCRGEAQVIEGVKPGWHGQPAPKESPGPHG